ncbi:MAG: S41 family peptidase [Pseudomonadota bacterium]
MRRSGLAAILAAGTLAACGGGGGDTGPLTGVVPNECSLENQKQFVLDQMRDIYFWNTDLPASVDISAFATPEDLLAFLISFQPLDSFSFINSAQADAQFFGEGQFVGFGFSYRFEGNEARFTRVYAGSPADQAGLARGQTILAVGGQTVAALGPSGFANALGPAEEGVSREFRVRQLDGSEETLTAAKALVTIDPVPQTRLIDVGTGVPVGYLELSTFISTADAEFAAAFSEFAAAGVTDVILDLRYNGGGLVRTAETLGDYLGGAVSPGEVFSKTLYNADNANLNSEEPFATLADSLALSRFVVIATGNTASASELVINGLSPHATTVIVGDRTFGKPVGQVGITFCDKILRPTAFEKVNSLDEGGFFDGLPADCPAADDLDFATGSDMDPSLQAGLFYLQNGACPATLTLENRNVIDAPVRQPPRNAWEAYAGAY